MKKSSQIIILLVFLLGTTGVTISQHYCHGKLISFSFVGKAHSCCAHGCKDCHNALVVNKVKDNFNSSTFNIGTVKVLDLLKLLHTPLLIAQNLVSPDIPTLNFIFKSAPPLINSESPEFLEIFRI